MISNIGLKMESAKKSTLRLSLGVLMTVLSVALVLLGVAIVRINAVSPVYEGYCLNVPVILYHHIQPMAEAKAKGQQDWTIDNEIFDSQMEFL